MSLPVAFLKDRSECLQKARQFFLKKGLIEVDCPLLSPFASVDPHIDLIEARCFKERRFLHSSPEYGMKRLLAFGSGDIFQLSHVFRLGEIGQRHNPEFMLAEWYRLNVSFESMIEETCDFCLLFLGKLPVKKMSYRQVFIKYASIDPLTASIKELQQFCQALKTYPGIEKEDKEAFLNLILAELIEPHLGKEELFVLYHYPKEQAALAKVGFEEGFEVAKRFELYFQGVELANGYLELADPKEQRERLESANQKRRALGKEALPIDEAFLNALEKGLPPCCGVAVGFDRLQMLRHKKKTLREVLPFVWDTA